MVLEAGGVTVDFGWGWGGVFVGMAVAVASRVVGGEGLWLCSGRGVEGWERRRKGGMMLLRWRIRRLMVCVCFRGVGIVKDIGARVRRWVCVWFRY